MSLPIKAWDEYAKEAGLKAYTLDHPAGQFKCGICANPYSQYQSFYSHVLCHYNVTYERYKCRACNKCCVGNADLSLHIINTHPDRAAEFDITPVAVCDKCGKDCALQSVLTRHIKWSKKCGGRTATCEVYDGCARIQQNDKQKNDRHIVLHQDCQYCGMTFPASISRGPKSMKDKRLLAECLEAHEAMCEDEHDIRGDNAPRFATLRNRSPDDYIRGLFKADDITRGDYEAASKED